MVVGQLAVSEKTKEITAIPQLLEMLDTEENVFTIDAIGTQKKIEEKIVSNGGHFVLQVKKNNPALYEEIITSFDGFEKELGKKPEERSKTLKPYTDSCSRWKIQEKKQGEDRVQGFQGMHGSVLFGMCQGGRGGLYQKCRMCNTDPHTG